MATFTKNVYLMYCAHFLKMLFPLLLFPIVARAIPPSDFGAFVFYQTITIVVSCIVEFGFAFTAVNSIAASKSRFEEAEHVNSVEKSKVLLCVLLLALSSIYTLYSFDFVFMVAAVSGCASGMTANYYYQGREKFAKITKSELLGILVYYSISILCMKIGLDYYWLIISYSASRFVVFLGLTEHLRLLKPGFSFSQSFNYLKTNFLFFIHRSSFVVYSSMSVFIVEHFLGKSELALYSAAEKIVFVLCGLIQPLQQVLLPYLSKNVVTFKIKTSLSLMLIISIGVSISAPLYSEAMFKLYYGGEIYLSYHNFNYLIWLLPLKFSSSMILVVFFLSKNKARPFSKIYTKLVVISFVVSMASVKYFGVIGMIVNLIVFEASLIMLSVWKIRNEKINI
jgi:polysaccharide transporter, PST family